MKRFGTRTLQVATLACAALFIGGCATRTPPPAGPPEPPPRFSQQGSAERAPRWWTSFEDPQLERLVEQALTGNLDLASAWQRLRQARALVERRAGELYPLISAEAEALVREPEGGGGDQYFLGLAAAYEVDLWGRIRSAVDAERFRAVASLEDYQTLAVSLSAEVARTWYRLVEAREQRALLVEQVETNERVLKLLRARFGSGQIRAVDILRQRQLVEATRERRIDAETRVALLEHQLALLLGRPPREGVAGLRGELPGLPPLPSTGLPAELVRRRPDIRRAHALLRAADSELAAAVTNQYPRLSLSASLGTAGESADLLFDEWLRSFAANLFAPLFDGGERRAEVARAEALRNERLFDYGQATLEAFREVEDALVLERKQLERIESLREQLRLADVSYEQLQIEFFNGLADYIDVLTALSEQQQLRRDLLAARLTLLDVRIGLHRALAGGFATGREGAEEPEELEELEERG